MKRAVVVAVFLLAWSAALSAQSVPNPNVAGPIPAVAAPGDASHNYTFFSTNVDLASKGYVEEEFFFDGTANTYNIDPSVPKSDNAVVTSSGNSYKTRMVVRRPQSAKDFNGTVLMEWQNVTAGYEIDALWIASHDHLIREGYAWIGVSVQRLGMYSPIGLRAWSPSRYGTLNIPNTGAIVNDVDGLAWDIFSQAAQAVRHPQGTDPMGGLPVERIFAVGWSQGAVHLAIYHNSIHPLAQVFDAFALIGLDGRVLLPLRTDLDVKVFKVQPETNVAGFGLAISQALLDVQEPNSDHFRRWEVAGAAQLGYHELREGAPLQARDLGLSASTLLDCDSPPLSRIPWHFVMNESYDSLVKWVKNNEPPPVAPDIVVMTPGQVSVLLRDGYGNALGGIRLSQIAVPTATNTGENSPVDNMCRYLGSYVPFDAGTLNALYPHHGTYVNQVVRVTHENQARGFIDGADAAETIREAAHSEMGK